MRSAKNSRFLIDEVTKGGLLQNINKSSLSPRARRGDYYVSSTISTNISRTNQLDDTKNVIPFEMSPLRLECLTKKKERLPRLETSLLANQKSYTERTNTSIDSNGSGYYNDSNSSRLLPNRPKNVNTDRSYQSSNSIRSKHIGLNESRLQEQSKLLYGFEEERPSRINSNRSKVSRSPSSLSPSGLRYGVLDSLKKPKVEAVTFEKQVKQKAKRLPVRVYSEICEKYISLKQARRMISLVISQLIEIRRDVTERIQYKASTDVLDKKKHIKYEVYNGQSSLLNRMRQAADTIISKISSFIAYYYDKPQLTEFIEHLIDTAKESKSYELHLAVIKTAAKSSLACRDVQKGALYFRQFKTVAGIHKSYINKARAYKYLQLCAQENQNYKKAINYAIKMLKASWICNNEDYELLAYDLLGLQCFYLGDLEKAGYFHARMSQGKTEPEDSALRKLAIAEISGASNITLAKKERKKAKNPLASNNDFSVLSSSEEETELPIGIDYEEAVRDLRKRAETDNGRLKYIYAQKKINTKKKIPKLHESASEKELAHHSIPLYKPEVQVYDGTKSTMHLMQPALISHLSPNRKLHNFVVSGGQGLNYISAERANEAVDFGAMLKANQIFEKFRINLCHVRDILADIITSSD